jgi:hypothetical protein
VILIVRASTKRPSCSRTYRNEQRPPELVPKKCASAGQRQGSIAGTRFRLVRLRQNRNERIRIMPILLWLLGVPISIVLLLMLFGVIGF